MFKYYCLPPLLFFLRLFRFCLTESASSTESSDRLSPTTVLLLLLLVLFLRCERVIIVAVIFDLQMKKTQLVKDENQEPGYTRYQIIEFGKVGNHKCLYVCDLWNYRSNSICGIQKNSKPEMVQHQKAKMHQQGKYIHYAITR